MKQSSKNRENVWQLAANEIFPSNNNRQNDVTKAFRLYGNYASQVLDSANDYLQSTLKNATSTSVYVSKLNPSKELIETWITLQNNYWGQVSDYLALHERCTNSAFKVAKEHVAK